MNKLKIIKIKKYQLLACLQKYNREVCTGRFYGLGLNRDVSSALFPCHTQFILITQFSFVTYVRNFTNKLN